MNFVRCSILSALAPAIVAISGTAALADLTNFDSFGNQEYFQTANNTAPSGAPMDFYASRLFYDTTGDVTSATGTSANSSQFSYTPQSGNYALAQTGFLTPSQLNDYLASGGSLNFNVTGGNLASESGSSPTYGSPLFPTAVPYLTGNSYNMLQGLDSTQSVTLTINGFNAVAGANESDVFITITNSTTNAVAYSTEFINQPGTTSFSIDPNTLAAGTMYNLEVDYSSRLNGTGTFNGNDLPFTAGYDNRTEIGFFTVGSVPEPSSLALTALGVASALLAARRRRTRASA